MGIRFPRALAALLLGCGVVLGHAAPAPVRLGLDLEISDVSSTSDEAVRLGAEQAVKEVNARGGVLHGRPLELVVRDNRSVPVRGVENLKAFAAMPDVVAVMGGKFSPVALEQVKVLPEQKIIFLDPWAAADGIIQNGQSPNWAFRLSLSDTMAVSAVLGRAARDGHQRLGVLLPNIAWGRSNHEALKAQAEKAGMTLAAVEWYNWGGDPTLMQRYIALRQAGAQAIFLVANETEGAQFIRELAALPKAQHLPIISHWGITGGDFVRMAGSALDAVDLVVVQTYAFSHARNDRARRLAHRAQVYFAVDHPDRITSPVGVAQAYDLTCLLARAIDRAGTTERAAVRAALERLGPYDGVVKHLAAPFAPNRHEALSAGDLFFSRYRADGRLTRDGRN